MANKQRGLSMLLLVCTLLAGWPHWLWLARRLSDGSDEPWGIIALLTLLVLIYPDRAMLRLPGRCCLAIAGLLISIATLLWGLIPPIFASACAVLGLSGLAAGMLPKSRPRFPLLLMALLALPLTASLNFYAGYPLRWLCAQAAAPILAAAGLSVTPQGAALFWNGNAVLIDAPCAGIAMLWLGAYLATLMSYLNSAGLGRSLMNLVCAMGVVVAANILRNTLLFYKESGIVQWPQWTHEGIGLLLFGFIVLAIYQITASAKGAEDHVFH